MVLESRRFRSRSRNNPYDVPYGWISDIQTQNSFMPVLQFTGLHGARSNGNLAKHGVSPADYPSATVANYMPMAIEGFNVSEITMIQGGKTSLLAIPKEPKNKNGNQNQSSGVSVC
jgi:hypothetical protein